MLSSANLEGTIVNGVAFVPFNLSRGMDGPSFAMVSALSEDADRFTTLCDYLCTCINNLERVNLMVINPSNVHFLAWVCVKYVCIISNDAAVCSPIN